MTSVPTFATRPSFLGIERTNTAAAICIAGILFDLGTSKPPGGALRAGGAPPGEPHAGRWRSPGLLGRNRGDGTYRYRRLPDRAWRHPGNACGDRGAAAPIEHLVALGGDTRSPSRCCA